MGVLYARVAGAWVPIGGAAQVVAYTHVQGTPASTWTINHGLTFDPNVTVIDSAGNQVEGDVSFPAAGIVSVSFRSSAGPAAFSGKAYLS